MLRDGIDTEVLSSIMFSYNTGTNAVEANMSEIVNLFEE